MKTPAPQAELFGLIWWGRPYKPRLCVNDVLRINGRLCRVIRVNDCAAVVLMNRPRREFKTRFDRPVSFQPSPVQFRISPQSEVEIVNRNPPAPPAGARRRR
jgi:hypothetical protein